MVDKPQVEGREIVMGVIAEELERRLREKLDPDELTVIDQSESHRGHTGWRSSGETHFHVRVCSHAFEGCSRLDRQRLVFAAVGDLMKSDIHALSIEALFPARESHRES
jgi:BolA protein